MYSSALYIFHAYILFKFNNNRLKNVVQMNLYNVLSVQCHSSVFNIILVLLENLVKYVSRIVIV